MKVVFRGLFARLENHSNPSKADTELRHYEQHQSVSIRCHSLVLPSPEKRYAPADGFTLVAPGCDFPEQPPTATAIRSTWTKGTEVGPLYGPGPQCNLLILTARQHKEYHHASKVCSSRYTCTKPKSRDLSQKRLACISATGNTSCFNVSVALWVIRPYYAEMLRQTPHAQKHETVQLTYYTKNEAKLASDWLTCRPPSPNLHGRAG